MKRRGHTGFGRWRGLALGVALLAATRPALAQDDQTRASARELAQRGADAFNSGDFEAAQDLFHRAYTLMQAPSLSLREARALVKLGRLVEALDAYARTTRTTVDDKSPPAYREAVDAAANELEALRPRVPQLKIMVEGGAPGQTASVTIDGKAVSPALIGVASPSNPGTHEIVATTSGGSSAKGSVELVEGETKEVRLTLTATGGAVTAATTRTASTPTGSTRSPQRLWGFVALGVGAVGVGTGVVTGLMATSKHSSAQSECPNSTCIAGSQGEQDLNSFRTLRTVSTVGYIVGGIGAAAGVTLLILAPKNPPPSSARLELVVSPTTLGVIGAF